MKEFLIITVISVVMFVAGYYTKVFVSWLQDVDDDIDNDTTEY